jgi:hypothetical protein
MCDRMAPLPDPAPRYDAATDQVSSAGQNCPVCLCCQILEERQKCPGETWSSGAAFRPAATLRHCHSQGPPPLSLPETQGRLCVYHRLQPFRPRPLRTRDPAPRYDAATDQVSIVTSVNTGSTFALRCSTLDFCLGGQRSHPQTFFSPESGNKNMLNDFAILIQPVP